MLRKKILMQARQIKAARALLDWSQDKLAVVAHVSVATIRKLEQGTISPKPETLFDIQNAFEVNGVEFIEPGGCRLLPDDVFTFNGDNGINAFLDDIYQSSRRKPGEILIVCSSEASFLPPNSPRTQLNLERMKELKGKVFAKCILTETPKVTSSGFFSEYRQIAPICSEAIPFCVYGEKCALMVYANGHPEKIILVQSVFISQRFRKQFQCMWDKAVPLMSNPEIAIQSLAGLQLTPDAKPTDESLHTTGLRK